MSAENMVPTWTDLAAWRSMVVFCTSYISAYQLPDNKPFLLIHKGLLLVFSFFDLGCNCNILAQLYLVGVVQLAVWKKGTGFFL